MDLSAHNLFGTKPKGFGIEIENNSLKALELEKKRNNFRIMSFGKRNIKEGIVKNGMVLDPAGLAGEIKEMMRSTRPRPIKNKYVVFSIPETKAFIRTIKIPKMSRDEAEEAVKWETEANIPVAVDRVYLDWQVIAPSDEQEEVLVVAVPRDVVDGYWKAAELAGLTVMAIEIDIIATIRSFTTEKNNKKPWLIVDIGAERTSFAICKNQVPYFTSSIPLCGNTFTDALQKGLGVSREKAEDVKSKYGLGKMKEDDMLYKIYNPLVENLASEIDRSINFFGDSINSQEKIEQVILCGGGSLTREMVDYLSEKLKRKVILGDLAVNLGLDDESRKYYASELLSYATSIGLALRAADCEQD